MKFDSIIIGGTPQGFAKAVQLANSGKKTALVSNGRSLGGFDPKEFEKAGGVLFMDRAVASEIVDGKVQAVYTQKLGSSPLKADEFYLASGRFFEGGLVADMDRMYEPVFGIDTRYEQDRSLWFSENFADPQPFMDYGVLCQGGCAIKDGQKIVNLFPLGEIIAK